MRRILFIILLSVLSAKAETLVCQQNARDIRLELNVDKDKVRLFVLSPMGYSYFNFLDQPASEANLVNLKYQAEQLRPLGSSFWAEWDKKDCKIQIQKPLKDTMLECSSKAVKNSTDKVEFMSLSISTLTDQSFVGTFKSLKFRMVVSAAGESGSDFFFLGIPVYETACISL